MSEIKRVWVLTDEHINDLQVADVDAAIKRCKAAHWTNLRIRINGTDEQREADWIKHLVPVDSMPGADALALRAQLMEAHATIRRLHSYIDSMKPLRDFSGEPIGQSERAL